MNDILYLNCFIFNVDDIKQSIDDYSKIARIVLNTDGEYYSCRFNDCKYQKSLVKMEFENYLISVSNRRMK